jgi:hypothetical protein
MLFAALFAFGAAFLLLPRDHLDDRHGLEVCAWRRTMGVMIGEGTQVDEDFLEDMVVSQLVPASLADDFRWALDDTPRNRVNLIGQVFTRDVPAGAFLDRTLFFEAPRRRIRPADPGWGHRAFLDPGRGPTVRWKNFIAPGSRVDVLGTFELLAGAA